MPRKQLKELRALYELEPTLRDVFVEGSFDLTIIKWFLGVKNFQHVGVYQIETVEIPDGHILEQGRKANNYERLVFLAQYATRVLGSEQNQVTCIVDRDFVDFLNSATAIKCLLYTDYSCMEMYLLNEATLQKFFTIYCNRSDWPTGEIISTLSGLLQELFLFRLANEALGWEMGFLDNLPCIEVNSWSITFDAEDFLRRYLNKNSRMSAVGEFSRTVDSFREKLTTDIRNQSHGHDFVEVICWFVREKGIAGILANPKIVGRVLAVSLDPDQLSNTCLFQSLVQRVSS